MSNTPDALLEAVVEGRRKQVRFRLGVCLGTATFYAQVLGWRIALGWTLAYVVLQAIEFACFGRRRLPSTATWFGLPVMLLLLAANSLVFGSLSLIFATFMGAWGGVCAAYLLAGSVLNTVLTTFGCRPAFHASLLPFGLYLAVLPLWTLRIADAPSPFVALAIGIAGMLLVMSAVRLWREWTAAKAAEVAAVQRDIAERTANEQRLFRLAHVDALTGLANRTVMQARLADMEAAQAVGTLLMVDLDGFKYVNDTLGHSAGDEVLRQVAGRIAASAREGDITARLGGDEFAVLLPGVADAAPSADVAERIIAAVGQPVLIDGRPVTIGASIGIAIYNRHGTDAEALFANADLALYRAKNDGRHCVRFFDPTLRMAAQGRMLRDTELGQACANGEFELFYQPQIRLCDGALTGAEALLRWRHPQRGLLTPAAFLPALEDGRLAAHVGEWVLETACRDCTRWRAQARADVTVAVNLFGAQFRSGNLAGNVREACARAGLPPSALELEITENVILRHEDDSVRPLRDLRASGVGIAFDDYGTGYASLSLLKRYPLSRLKIDRTFIGAICASTSDTAIVRAVISLARAFSLDVIAEGVETQDQVDALLLYGCDHAQGHFFGDPMPAAQFAELVGGYGPRRLRAGRPRQSALLA